MLKGSIQTKLFAAFGTMIALILVVGGLGYWTMNKTDKEYTTLIDVDVALVEVLDDVRVEQAQVTSDMRGYMIYRDRTYLESLNENQQQLTDDLVLLEQSMREENNRKLAKEAQTIAASYNQAVDELVQAVDAEDAAKVQTLGAEMASDSRSLLALITEMDQAIHDRLNSETDVLSKSIAKTSLIIGLGIVVATIIGLTIAYFISRSIVNPVRRLTHHIQEMAEGNLRLENLPVEGKDEIATMSTSFNTMLSRLSNLVRGLNDSSSNLAAQSEQLSASSEESLASSEMVARAAEKNTENSETQAEHVAQSVQAMNEVSRGVDHISESNEEMLQSAVEMGDYINEGRTVIGDVSEQMGEIFETIKQSTEMMDEMAKKSAEIQEVSSLITNISEQTNLLALNAAIEAARAGEHGAGFAVVANEVRQLAEESHKSAAKIDEMIADVYGASQQAVASIRTGEEKVHEGLNRSNESLEVFGHIESSVTNVGEMIESVSAAIQQIQAMTESVMTSSESLRGLAEEAAASAQETGAATEEQLAAMQEITTSTESLAKLAEDLQEEVQQFRV